MIIIVYVLKYPNKTLRLIINKNADAFGTKHQNC